MSTSSPTTRDDAVQARDTSSAIDPATLMRIKNLEVRAKVVVEGFFSGLHRSPFHGFSVEFSEYRQYTPGDDLRYLDWRLFARSDRYYIKRFEDETNLRCHLIFDLSSSMAYGSLSYTKAEYAKTVAATLAFFLGTQRDAVGLVTFSNQVHDHMPARFRPGHLHRLMLCLEKSFTAKETRLDLPLEQVVRTVKKRGMVVLISDLLAPIDKLESHLGYLRSRGHECVVMRVLDPAELDLSLGDAAMIQDLESGRQLYIDPEEARDEYCRKFGEHAEQVRKTCANLGIDYYEVTTDRPVEWSLFDFLNARLRRGRTTTRRGSRVQGGAG